MTEVEWYHCPNPEEMLECLPVAPSDRKHRLLAGACCRRGCYLLLDDQFRRGLEVAEAVAEGQATVEALHYADGMLSAVLEPPARLDDAATYLAHLAALGSLCEAADLASNLASYWSAGAAALAGVKPAPSCWNAAFFASAPDTWLEQAAVQDASFHNALVTERLMQASIVRDLFADLFFTCQVHPSWRQFSEGFVPKLAAAIYEGQDFDRLPILADALEDAGCCVRNILDHCRSPGPHVRGCWVLDLLRSVR
jgi:hypothetical protein